MPRAIPLLVFVAALTCGLAVPALPQELPEAPADADADLPPPLHVANVDGAVTLTRDAVAGPLDLNAPILEGDRVQTAATSRAELAAPAWGHLFLDVDTSLELRLLDRVRVSAGRVRVQANDAARDTLRVDTPVAGVVPSEAGSFVVEVGGDARGQEVALTVYEGSAELQTDRGALTVRAGQTARARDGAAPELARTPRASGEDDFAAYVEARLRAYEAPADAAADQALPGELAEYSATLSRHGDWEYEPSQGYVWYPSVAEDWQPYADAGKRAAAWERFRQYVYQWY